jgi:hypothetical protein
MDTLVVRKRGEGRWLPRHVTVPFLAGLLVAVVVLVLLRLAASDHKPARDGGLADGSRVEATSGGGAAGGSADSPFPGGSPRATSTDFPVLPRLGPGTIRLLPNDVRYFRQVSSSADAPAAESPRLDDLIDGSTDTCLLPGRAGLPGRIELVFPTYRRFSHVTFVVGCLEGPDAAATSRITVETEGGIHRTVLLPAVKGAVTADLAGSWTSRIVLRLDDPGLASLGISELRFFVFREEGDAPGS